VDVEGGVGQPGRSALLGAVVIRWAEGGGGDTGRGRHIYLWWTVRWGQAERSPPFNWEDVGTRFPSGSRYSFACLRVIVRGRYDGYCED
jgi:hypothetical protein